MDVVCLHGIGRTRFSMAKLARHLRGQGHRAHLFGYHKRQSLRCAAVALAEFLRVRGFQEGGPDLGFVAHSAGGVLLRYLALELPSFRAGRSVALGSPIDGSIIAKNFSQTWVMKAAYGDVLHSLHPAEVTALPPPPCELAAIAGSRQRAFVPAAVLLRWLARDQPSDSTVLVEETRLPGIEEWIEVPVAHTFLPADKGVHVLVSRFLSEGAFHC